MARSSVCFSSKKPWLEGETTVYLRWETLEIFRSIPLTVHLERPRSPGVVTEFELECMLHGRACLCTNCLWWGHIHINTQGPFMRREQCLSKRNGFLIVNYSILFHRFFFCPKAPSRKYSLYVSENSESVLEEVRFNVGLSGWWGWVEEEGSEPFPGSGTAGAKTKL